MSSKILRKMRGEQVSIRQPECVAGRFAAPKTVRRFALWVPGFSIFSEEVVSSSGALCSALLGYYLFTRHTVFTECQPSAPEEPLFSLVFFQPHHKPSYSSLTLHAEIADYCWIISVQAILSTWMSVSLDKDPDGCLHKANDRIHYITCIFRKSWGDCYLYPYYLSLRGWMSEATVIASLVKEWLF